MATRHASIAVVLFALGSAFVSASAADDPKGSTRSQYDAERARCLGGTTGQDQASCLKSAGAARDALDQKRLQDPSTAYRDNALARCKTVPAADRADCETRIDGAAPGTNTGVSTSGSVRDGGILRETTTRTSGAPEPVVPPTK